jgi:hypothetical protein
LKKGDMDKTTIHTKERDPQFGEMDKPPKKRENNTCLSKRETKFVERF